MEDCIYVRSDAIDNLDAGEVFDLLSNADTVYKDLFSTVPPVQPAGGSVFLYDLGEDESQWDCKRKRLRYDCCNYM